MRIKTLRMGWAAAPVALAFLLTACAVGPDYTAPTLELPESYRAGPQDSPAAPRTAPSPRTAPWWAGFDDPVLDRLMDRALTDNLDIEVARERLSESLAFVRAERSDLFPILDGTGGAIVRNGPGSDRSSATIGAAFFFTPDLFGRQRRRLQQAQADARGQAWVVEDTERLTAFSVTSQYVELRRTQARLELLATSLDLQSQTLDIVRQRLGAGLSSDLDAQRAEADLARTQAQRGTLEAARARAENDLTLLLGESSLSALGDLEPGAPVTDLGPDEAAPAEGEAYSDAVVPLFDFDPPTSVPAALLRSRADILAAEENLKAATAAIGVETADLYPALRLPGQITAAFGGANAAAGAVTSSLNAALDIPLFDAGRRRAEIRAASARAGAARALYERTVLEALSAVENAFAAIDGAQQRRSDLQRAIDASERSFNQLNALYREGLASFIDILDAQRTLINSREAFVEANADLAQGVIDLYTALGQSDPERPPS